jgi:hypothetical protein
VSGVLGGDEVGYGTEAVMLIQLAKRNDTKRGKLGPLRITVTRKKLPFFKQPFVLFGLGNISSVN